MLARLRCDGGADVPLRSAPTVVFLDRQGIVPYFGNELLEDYAAHLDALLAKAS